MAFYDVSPQIESLLGDATTLGLLPPELLHVIQSKSASKLLDVIAQAALIPRLTSRIFAHFEPVFADICARWLLNSTPGSQNDNITASFARILPFSPHLSILLDRYLANTNTPSILALEVENSASLPPDHDLLRILVAIWRLVSFDQQVYSPLAPPFLQSLFRHQNPALRYIAVRIFCQLYSASDHKLESLLQEYVPTEEPLLGDLDGVEVDYNFLTLFEHQRARDLEERLHRCRARFTSSASPLSYPQILTPLVVAWGRTVIPRPAVSSDQPSRLVKTPMTSRNLESIAMCLKDQEPILLRGLPGVGKTSLVMEVARELGMSQGLVSLYLNEQTDAKMLIGLYSSTSKPGSFQWRPGILTTAVREGRWVLIEDLDRAPKEVISTILPLIERRELLIPNRNEVIKAPRSFRIFATIRTSMGMHGEESTRALLGERLWQSVAIVPLPRAELRDVLEGSFPLLHHLVSDIISTFNQLETLSPRFMPGSLGRKSLDRPINLRDLMKWCRRLEHTVSLQNGNGAGGLSDTVLCFIFLDAIDCFLGSVKEDGVRRRLSDEIGQALRMAPQTVQFSCTARIPDVTDDEQGFIVVGRAKLPKLRRLLGPSKSSRPFASTTHSKRLLEQISMAVCLKEPVLLVGETGIGKTAVVQRLAQLLGHKLVAINLSQQSEVGDLLGGFKPVNIRSLAVPLKEEFDDLFRATGISTETNRKYLGKIDTSIAKGKWTDLSKLLQQAPRIFAQILQQLQAKQSDAGINGQSGEQPTKRRKTRLPALQDLKPRWHEFGRNLEQFDIQVSGGSSRFAFAFIEGKLVKAVRNGDWVLLDEINLASPDTLESIADLLVAGSSQTPSILLSETGEIERIKAHPNFRVFAAMNPATDVGKRDLPIGLRSRFTELYVGSPDQDPKDLGLIVETYLKGNTNAKKVSSRVVNLYLAIKGLADAKSLVDGANEVPHFSLRTLTRVLTYVNEVAPFYGLDRALFEGFCMGFLTLLSQHSEDTVMPKIVEHLFGGDLNNRRSRLAQPPRYPSDGREYVRFMDKDKERQYWLLKGEQVPQERHDYIRTPYVERNLLNLVRATSTRRFPILIQGPTSSGKTSMIEYLANFSGNKFVRINNHEHTDLQEYLGSYVSGLDGSLKFQEGALVQAMRFGHWIVLDELNLAPTDVLEALNRLLDDNRELLIPETQEIVRPHERFMLFATQNPPGIYGGRKILSRAFRNRFLELHFDDIPENELGHILQKRCINTAPSDCERIVTVYKELSRLRQTTRVFEQKNSFATLRDLFRWGLREADNREQIACHGFMLLGERVRDEEERMAVKEVIEMVFKVKIEPTILYDAKSSSNLNHVFAAKNSQGVVWTGAMRRLYVLVAQAIRNKEPVLLVGETGCGKTTVCQVLAESLGKELHIVNAHQNTETGDLIGSQRPIRNRGAIVECLKQDLHKVFGLLGRSSEGTFEELLRKFQDLQAVDIAKLPPDIKERITQNQIKSQALFEWCDGSLVHAMKTGQLFLLDEISLADDSVLERLNSVLEPQRTLLLAEKGIDDSPLQALEEFQFFATMNPGGDFGKKELSPALRNRFTEIWVPSLSSSEDIHDIVVTKLAADFTALSRIIVEFAGWFGKTFRSSSATGFSIRDILVWVNFINQCGSKSPVFALVHGAATVFIDTLGANPSALIAVDPKTMYEQRQKCLDRLSELLRNKVDIDSIYKAEIQLKSGSGLLWVGEFSIPVSESARQDNNFEFEAPTTKMNAMRIVRALQLDKPILLEGNPGVGKTSLVSALARATGRPLTRINLSDQTDLMDLFGTDVPVEGAEAGVFAWRDAPFLQAMQKGEWVLLDEMNLASQSVLEGLNACLDHRGEVYVAELDQVFKRHPDFRLFAAQNPHHQGGGRKGLPSSFVNRFIVVYADVLTENDQLRIAEKKTQKVSSKNVRQIINFISTLDDEIVVKKSFGFQGSPWEFNLRDTLRWLELAASTNPLTGSAQVEDFFDVIIRQRFRTEQDRDQVTKMFAEAFDIKYEDHSRYHAISSTFAQVGFALLQRNLISQPTRFPSLETTVWLKEIESIMICVQQNLPCILCGPSGSGKSTLLRQLAALAGKKLVVFSLNADVDSLDLVGGFEQADPVREVFASLNELRDQLQTHVLSIAPGDVPQDALDLLNRLQHHSGQVVDIGIIATDIQKVAPLVPSDSSLAKVLLRSYDQLQQPLTLDNPRFEWIDGMIVRAVQSGEWLVLDNANLCSASVLDRLNSLLERPDGFLSINEHAGQDGTPRIVRPHPDFRVFLTMDPKYGELSRAMRNRSVEVFIDQPPVAIEPFLQKIAPVDASMQRYYNVLKLSTKSDCGEISATQALSLDNLSLSDADQLVYFARSFEHGLSQLSETQTPGLVNIQALLSYIKSSDARGIRHAIFSSYKQRAEAMVQSTNTDEWTTQSVESFIQMQPLHPLHNSPVVSHLDHRQPHTGAHWLSTCYESYLELYKSHQVMQLQLQQINITKPSSLSRLQRSHVSHQIPTVTRDSTVKASQFLEAMLKTLQAHLDLYVEGQNTTTGLECRFILQILFHYWWRTFSMVSDRNFEEVNFQAHLSQGTSLLEDTMSRLSQQDDCALLQTVSRQLKVDFTTGFQLSTGLSMENLWHLLRPIPIPDAKSYDQTVAMESLAGRIDVLKWRAPALLPDIAKMMSHLVEAYGVMRENGIDASGLLQGLTKEVETLEIDLDDTLIASHPVLAAEFESLRQAVVLHGPSDHDVSHSDQISILALSDFPINAQMRLQSSLGVAKRLQTIDYLLCNDQDVHPWSRTLTASLLTKYQSLSSLGLGSLRRLEIELPLMGSMLARSSCVVLADAISKLNQILWELLLEVVASHSPSFRSPLLSAYEFISSHFKPSSIEISGEGLSLNLPEIPPMNLESCPEHLAKVMDEHFFAVIAALAASNAGMNRHSFTAIAWVQFAIGCIKLYTPDKIFDPYLKAQMEHDFHDTLLGSLQRKLTVAMDFEREITGQTTGERVKQLQRDIAAQGSGPGGDTSPIYRPPAAELLKIQKELFNPVLDVILKENLSTTHYMLLTSPSSTASQELQLLEGNVLRLIQRLSNQTTGYQDLSVPLVNLLRCLQLGLSLTRIQVAASPSSHWSSNLLSLAPFLGGRLSEIEDVSIPARSFEFLCFVETCARIDGISRFSSDGRKRVFQCFHFFYEEWSKKLEADRRAEEAKSSLFRFRGSAEDEEEIDENEFQELFPTHETEAAQQEMQHKSSPRTARDLAVEVADVHHSILISPRKTTDTLEAFCKHVARKVVGESSGTAQTEAHLDGLLLPATVLMLEENLSNFRSNSLSSTYNFYSDANIPEVLQLVTLIHDTQSRFRDLQRVDEIGHLQPLADVLAACEKLLELAHTESLAKILPRVEKLHEFLYEWQFRGYASRQYAAPALYDRATATIVRWRKAELATWSRLFDMEARKCRQDASSWWFIAYQAVIASPMTMMESREDLKSHSIQLLQELASYLVNSMMGQFGARLDLLRQMAAHLDLLRKDYPALDVVYNSLQNFIAFYGRYEQKVAETIKKGRDGLQKKMNDVVLLASWKDTNIAALRESAQKSHQKLFRLVRKFRAVLGQPMTQVLAQELPDTETNGVEDATFSADTPLEIDPTAASTCQRLIPDWGDDAQCERLSNADRILDIMVKTGTLPNVAVQASDIVNTFVGDLLASISALKKETPAFLTDENKKLIKHLKTRKTTLFSETLKHVRQMGFTRNLGEKRLATQKSLPVVFAKFGLLKLSQHLTLANLDEYFYKVVDMAPRFRAATHGHHSDLTNDAINRSLGYLEGIFSVAIQQREALYEDSSNLVELGSNISQLKELSLAKADDTIRIERKQCNDARILRWLIRILEVALRLVDIHGRMGGINNQPIHSQLLAWSDKFATLHKQLEDMSRLPSNFTCSSRINAQDQISIELQLFSTTIDRCIDERPDLAFILQQINLWTGTTTLDVSIEPEAGGFSSFMDSMLDISKKLLDAIQKFGKAVSTLPTSTEDAAWLAHYSNLLSYGLKALHMQTIINDVNLWIEQLKTIDLDDAILNQSASAVLRVLLPILQQYYNVCHRNTVQLAQLHMSTCKLGYHLSKSFIEIASQGFCTPQEKSDEKAGENGKMESGTGLGEGEGADDISKDIEPDEDLSELAQEANKEENGEIEDEKDAVDMGNDDLEGEMGSANGAEDDEEGSGSGNDDDGEDEMDEETGDVDDLDPTAVDEKMWDGDDQEEPEKEQQGNKSKGEKKDDEQQAVDTAPDTDEIQQDDGADQGETNEDVGPEQEEVLPKEELNKQDQTAQENDTLDLPEDMDIDGQDEDWSSSEHDELDNLSEVDQQDHAQDPSGQDVDSDSDVEEQSDFQKLENEENDSDAQRSEEDADIKGNDQMEVDDESNQESGPEDAEEARSAMPTTKEDAHMDADNAMRSDMNSGTGQTQEDPNDYDEQDQQNQDNAQRDEGEMTENGVEHEGPLGSKGRASDLEAGPPQSEQDQASDSKDEKPFKKLGDMLERWYKKQRDIRAPDSDMQSQRQPQQNPDEVAKKEFQHLQDENAPADEQALGTATDEEAKPLDESMAIDSAMEDVDSRLLPEQDNDDPDEKLNQMDVEPPEGSGVDKSDEKDRRSGVATRQGAYNRGTSASPEPNVIRETVNEDRDVQETSTQLSSTHINSHADAPLRDFSDSLQQWTSFQSKTHSLSLSLTSQLRLILTPSQSTKLSGSFRTGKRLNIKKIIPYIASSYKRDKIWMRRSIPTKRTYQILLCVDDSQSMGESNSGQLALESLVMVSRALTMLEAGQVGVLGFGEHVFTAHELAEPFATHEAGARVLQRFTFSQSKTDITLLIRSTIDHFRAARAQNTTRGGEDLWQLCLVLSDGLTQSHTHEAIRRLLREAQEEHIMVVFIMMDSAKQGDSVLDLKEVRFQRDDAGGTKVVIERYLDSFPFQYYLIVHDLEDLPSALAGLLRTWFAEVNA